MAFHDAARTFSTWSSSVTGKCAAVLTTVRTLSVPTARQIRNTKTAKIVSRIGTLLLRGLGAAATGADTGAGAGAGAGAAAVPSPVETPPNVFPQLRQKREPSVTLVPQSVQNIATSPSPDFPPRFRGRPSRNVP